MTPGRSDLSDEAHQAEFRTPEQVKLIHGRFKSEAEAEDALRKAKAGLPWRRYLGWLGRRRLDPALEQAAFALAEGEISGVLTGPGAYHVIKV